MNYDIGRLKELLGKALMVLVASENTLPERLQRAKAELAIFFEEGNRRDLSTGTLNVIKQIADIEDFREISADDAKGWANTFVDFICLALEDLTVAAQSTK